MTILLLTGLGAFLLASTIVGIRLLLLWRRSRELPELAIGLAFLLGGVLGYGLVVLAVTIPILPDPVARASFIAGLLSLDAGAGALWLFTWRVFHPGDSWARLLFFAATTLLLGAFVAQAVSGGLSVLGYTTNIWYWVGFLSRAGAFVWAAVESFLYFSALRKRVRLGLASRMDAQAFLFWGIATAAASLMFALTALGILLNEARLPASAVVAQSLAGLTAAGAIWLTFFPPAWYTRRVESGETSDEAFGDA